MVADSTEQRQLFIASQALLLEVRLLPRKLAMVLYGLHSQTDYGIIPLKASDTKCWYTYGGKGYETETGSPYLSVVE